MLQSNLILTELCVGPTTRALSRSVYSREQNGARFRRRTLSLIMPNKMTLNAQMTTLVTADAA
jgi:hypothetical protein